MSDLRIILPVVVTVGPDPKDEPKRPPVRGVTVVNGCAVVHLSDGSGLQAERWLAVREAAARARQRI